MSRRKLIKKAVTTAAAASAAMLAGHSLLGSRQSRYPAVPGPHPQQAIRLIRPPGAKDEPRFLAECIRCYRCQDACDPGSIQFLSESAGRSYHTPYIDPSIKGCTLCMKCTQVCPTGALTPLVIEDKATVAMATIELREDLCLSYKAKRIRDEQAMLPPEVRSLADEAPSGGERRGPCGECFMYCPLRGEAITLEPGAFLAPVVHKDKCVGCGMCEDICRVMVRGDQPAIRVVSTRGHLS
jgi:ferredoxin-type protein NapG